MENPIYKWMIFGGTPHGLGHLQMTGLLQAMMGGHGLTRPQGRAKKTNLLPWENWADGSNPERLNHFCMVYYLGKL